MKKTEFVKRVILFLYALGSIVISILILIDFYKIEKETNNFELLSIRKILEILCIVCIILTFFYSMTSLLKKEIEEKIRVQEKTETLFFIVCLLYFIMWCFCLIGEFSYDKKLSYNFFPLCMWTAFTLLLEAAKSNFYSN